MGHHYLGMFYKYVAKHKIRCETRVQDWWTDHIPDLDVTPDGVAHPLLPREELLQGSVLWPVVGDGDGRVPQHATRLGVYLVHHGRSGLVLRRISIDFLRFAKSIPKITRIMAYVGQAMVVRYQNSRTSTGWQMWSGTLFLLTFQ